MPRARSCATWSRIKAISGETTKVRPGVTSAGNWKHSDFPAPVGMTTRTSRRSSAAAQASACPARSLSRPNDVLNTELKRGSMPSSQVRVPGPDDTPEVSTEQMS